MSTSPTPPATVATAAAPADSSVPIEPQTEGVKEEELRRQLRLSLKKLKSREPLEGTYKRWLMNGIVTPRKPVLVKDKAYKKLGSQLRSKVEQFVEKNCIGKDPFDRIASRQPLEESAMRAAFTLRDAKEHEQQALLEATLKAMPKIDGRDQVSRKRHFDSVAMFLQSREPSASFAAAGAAAAIRSKTPPPVLSSSSAAGGSISASAVDVTEQARQKAELERQREQARIREAARRRREEEERREREEEINRRNKAETPQQALHKLYYKIFKVLWDMEFAQLGNINPFRIVIDRENCASVGAPDYFDVIDKPMNLTYIKQKVDAMKYDSLSAFFADVDLMINNALKYNSDPGNPYHIAAQDLKKAYKKMAKQVLQHIM